MAVAVDQLGVGLAHKAQMPRLIGLAGFAGLQKGIPDDETVFPAILIHPYAAFAVDEAALGLRCHINVQPKARLMLAGAGSRRQRALLLQYLGLLVRAAVGAHQQQFFTGGFAVGLQHRLQRRPVSRNSTVTG